MKIEEVIKKAEVHEQQLAVVTDSMHRERKYHNNGEVRNLDCFIFLVLSIDECSFMSTDEAMFACCVYWTRGKDMPMVTRKSGSMQQRSKGGKLRW